MNILPIAQVIQWQVQLAADRGVPVVYSSMQQERVKALELEEILNG